MGGTDNRYTDVCAPRWSQTSRLPNDRTIISLLETVMLVSRKKKGRQIDTGKGVIKEASPSDKGRDHMTMQLVGSQ